MAGEGGWHPGAIYFMMSLKMLEHKLWGLCGIVLPSVVLPAAGSWPPGGERPENNCDSTVPFPVFQPLQATLFLETVAGVKEALTTGPSSAP